MSRKRSISSIHGYYDESSSSQPSTTQNRSISRITIEETVFLLIN